MPVEIVGMIGANPPRGEANVHVIGGSIDVGYLQRFAQVHEASDFDRVLVGYSSASADGFLLTQAAAAATERIRFLLAHRPGFVSPSLAARKAATLDSLTGGRVAMHIISGGSDVEQHRDGDYVDHDGRYRRSAEFMQILRRSWAASEPFDFEGEFYHLEGAYSDVEALPGGIPIYYGGQSEAALRAARYCDVFAMWGEPLAAVREKIDEVYGATDPHGFRPGISVSFRPILGRTEDEAWAKAHDLLKRILDNPGRPGPLPLGSDAARPEAVGSRRLLDLADEKEIHDERLWLPIAAATGAAGNTSALVGTPAQVVESLIRYYDLGVRTILIRGFDPLEDAEDYGRELIPLLREAVAARDRAAPESAGTRA